MGTGFPSDSFSTAPDPNHSSDILDPVSKSLVSSHLHVVFGEKEACSEPRDRPGGHTDMAACRGCRSRTQRLRRASGKTSSDHPALLRVFLWGHRDTQWVVAPAGFLSRSFSKSFSGHVCMNTHTLTCACTCSHM